MAESSSSAANVVAAAAAAATAANTAESPGNAIMIMANAFTLHL